MCSKKPSQRESVAEYTWIFMEERMERTDFK
jgi:hypothetical protein